MKVKYTL